MPGLDLDPKSTFAAGSTRARDRASRASCSILAFGKISPLSRAQAREADSITCRADGQNLASVIYHGFDSVVSSQVMNSTKAGRPVPWSGGGQTTARARR